MNLETEAPFILCSGAAWSPRSLGLYRQRGPETRRRNMPSTKGAKHLLISERKPVLGFFCLFRGFSGLWGSELARVNMKPGH